jgi:hypothetical protein
VEERLLGHPLQVDEHRVELPVAGLVRREDLGEMVEEGGLPDAPLAGDHEAVAVQRAQHASGEPLPSVEHALVEDGGAGDVGVEAPAHGPAAAQPVADPAQPHQGEGGRPRRGEEQRRLVEAQAPLHGDGEGVGETAGVGDGDADLVQAGGERELPDEGPHPGGAHGVVLGNELAHQLAPHPELQLHDGPVVGGHSLEGQGVGPHHGPLRLEEEDLRLPIRKPLGEESLAGALLRDGEALGGSGVSGVELEEALEGDLGLGEAALGHELITPGLEPLDLLAQLALATEALEDLPVAGEELAGFGVVGGGGLGQRADRRLVPASVEQRQSPLVGGLNLRPGP